MNEAFRPDMVPEYSCLLYGRSFLCIFEPYPSAVISTDRLFIRPLAEPDTGFIFDLLNTERWIRFIGNRNIHSEGDALAYIRKINENPDTSFYTVTLKETNIPVGLITLIRRDYLDFRDIGFAFLPAYSGKGYAYEAAKAVLDSQAENAETLLAITLPDNKASIRLIEKLGLKFERVIERETESLYLYSTSPLT